MSFLLVDRISAFEPRSSATGTVQLPTSEEEFPLSLVVEAVGQLASFVAMESAEFTMRPVAAIAGEVLAHSNVPSGAELELEISVGALRPSAIRYGGVARVDGRVVAELRRCTGAMLPMATFDEPESVRTHLDRLLHEGLPPRTFPSRAEFSPRVVSEKRTDRELAEACLEAPTTASFYADHFPARAVYPATLLLDAKIAVAQRLLAPPETPIARLPRIRAVRNVKVRAFTPPGGRVEVRADATAGARDDGTHHVRLEAFSEGARVSTAVVELSSR